MKKIIKYIVVFVGTLLFASSCNDMLDVNQDPTKVSDPSLTVLLPTVEFRTAQVHFSEGYTGSQIAHQTDSYLGYYTNVRMTSVWTNLYLRILNNLDVLIEKADAEGSSYYAGTARLLKALNLGILTDTWEDAPYTEALKGSDNITPKYDKQQVIYDAIFELIDKGLRDLDESESFRSPGGDDLAYGGNVEQWKKLGHSLRARYLLHLSNKNIVSWDSIANEAARGILDNADNFVMSYDEKNPNPWYTNVAVAYETGNLSIAPGKYLIDMMNGADGGPVDPRLPLMTQLKEGETDYVGLLSWDPNAPANTCDIRKDTWYGRKDAPLVMFSAAETRFIMAEALYNTGGDYATALTNGIGLHMSMLGVDNADVTTYVDAIMSGTIGLSDIMKQKYIALFLNGEVWTDLRRYHFSTVVYPNFVVPDDSEGRLGGPAQRSLYPTSEETRNGANVPNVDILAPMWRDQ